MSAYRFTTRLRLAWIKKRHGHRPIQEVLKYELALLNPKEFELSAQLALAQLSIVTPAMTLTRVNDQLIRLLELLDEQRMLDYASFPLSRNVVSVHDFLRSSQQTYEDPIPKLKAMSKLITQVLAAVDSPKNKASACYEFNSQMLKQYLVVVQELIHSLLKYTP